MNVKQTESTEEEYAIWPGDLLLDRAIGWISLEFISPNVNFSDICSFHSLSLMSCSIARAAPCFGGHMFYSQ
jgi:hypothetical protein